LSEPNLDFRLDSGGRHGVFLRDGHHVAKEDKSLAFGAFLNQPAEPHRGRRHDRPFAKAFSRALDAAGIRPSVKQRRALDYELGEVIMEGPGFQDFVGRHVSLKNDVRRVRVYTAPSERDEGFRELVRRAAKREYESLQGLQHPGILNALNYTETELGPALLFGHDPDARRLDHFMRERGSELGLDDRLDLVRDIAQALQSAHEHRVYHRGLSPLSVLVREDGSKLRPLIFNWQTAARQIETTTRGGATLTHHLESLVDSQAQVYLAPEAIRHPDGPGRDFDVFGMGALAYFILTGNSPASSRAELGKLLEENRGLRLETHTELTSKCLESMVSDATHPEVGSRLAGIDEFLTLLDLAEEELTDPDAERRVEDPLSAKPSDILSGDLVVLRRLGSGATSHALEVRDSNGRTAVLKIASDPRHNATLDDEAATLKKLQHRGIVQLEGEVSIAGLTGLLLSKAGEQTLAARLRQDGAIDFALLGGLGEDLLSVLSYLEAEGRWHRDLKPENIGVAEPDKKDGRHHLVVFDFSLSRIPADKTEVGTIAYLDPFLSKRGRYDVEAERYSAALVLHEMALGALPAYGDGKSDPALIEDDVVIDSERLHPSVRESLTSFFRRALSRNVKDRFPSAREMEVEWVRVFKDSAEPKPAKKPTRKSAPSSTEPGTAPSEPLSPVAEKAIEGASLDTETATLNLSTRAVNALHRADVLKVRDLLDRSQSAYLHQPGVGAKTRRELQALQRLVRDRFRGRHNWDHSSTKEESQATDGAAERPVGRSLDALLAHLLPKPAAKGAAKTAHEIITTLLGLAPEMPTTWPLGAGPTQSEVARQVGKTPGRVSQLLVQQRKRWAGDEALAVLRDEIDAELGRQGGVMTGTELTQHLLDLRGSTKVEPRRGRDAAAVLRCALEAESNAETPRYAFRRAAAVVLVARTESEGVDAEALFAYALALGREADRLAGLDPLLSPQRAREELEAVARPAGANPPSHERILRLASGASERACVASTAEIYPRGLAVARALKLASASLVAHKSFGLEAIQLERKLRLRYPEMADMPAVTELERQIADAGLDLVFDSSRRAFVPRSTHGSTVVTSTSAGNRLSTQLGQARLDSPEVAQAAAIEEKLLAAQKGGGFLVLGTSTKLLLGAERELEKRFAVRRRSLEAELLADMEEAGAENGIEWDTVVETDAGPRSSDDFGHLQRLAALAFEKTRQRWIDEAAEGETLLISRTGLLARLGLIPAVEALAEHVRRGTTRPAALWLLVAASDQYSQPVLEGQAIPVIGRAEWLRLEPPWVRNFHRAGSAAAAELASDNDETRAS
jgi:serine/threonine protein kinase